MTTRQDAAGGCDGIKDGTFGFHTSNDPDASARGRIPDKEAALVLLHHLLEKEPYVPKGPPRDWAGSDDGDAVRAQRWDEEETAPRREIRPLSPEVERRLRRSLGKLRSGPSAEG